MYNNRKYSDRYQYANQVRNPVVRHNWTLAVIAAGAWLGFLASMFLNLL